MNELKGRFESFLESRETLALILLGMVTLALRLACIVAIEIELRSDFLGYWTMATTAFDGKDMMDNYGLHAHLSAGYPYFLYGVFLVTGKSLWAAKIVNAILGLVSVLLLYRLGKLVCGTRAVAYLAATIWALYAPSILYCEYLAKENLMIPMFLGLLVLLTHVLQGNRPILTATFAGALFGLLLVVAAAALMMAPVAFLVILASRQCRTRRAATLAVFGVATALTLSPWLVRTNRLFGRPLLTTTGGMNLWVGNHEGAAAMFEFPTTPVGDTGKTWPVLVNEVGEAEADQVAKVAAITYMKAHPTQTVLLMSRKLVAFWWPPTHEHSDTSRATALVMKLWLIQYLAIGFFAVVGIVGSWRNVDKLWMLYLTIAGYTGVHMIIYVIYRYRIPIEPVVDLLAAQGVWIALGMLKPQAGNKLPSGNP